MIVLDVDGVLTDGKLFFSSDGEAIKGFHVRDGMGITLAHRAGIHTAIITGRTSKIVAKRAGELHIQDVCQGSSDKWAVLTVLRQKYHLDLTEICYIGDDLNDLPLVNTVGFSCAVADGAAEVKEAADYITQYAGGCGAVREVVEYILKAQGRWDDLVATYRKPGDHQLCQ